MSERAPRMAGKSVWTEELDDRLRNLFDNGRSAAEIATEIGGVTRNAVIGRLHRLKLRRGTTVKQAASAGGVSTRNKNKRRASREIFEQGKKATKPVFKIKRPPEDIQPPTFVPEPPPMPLALNVTFDALQKRQCKWPIGDGPFLFCGAKRWEEKPYCEYHCRIAYQPVQKREARDNERLAARTA